MSSSTTTSSSSLAKQKRGHPKCFCEIEAQLRYSNTQHNPGRPFLSCPKYNKERLPYCKYFKWVDGHEYPLSDPSETHTEISSKEKELKKKLVDIEKIIIDLRKRVDDFEFILSNRNEELLKELVAVVREAEIRRSRILVRGFWALAFVLAYYLVVM
ncbi:uncharacterized protein LOC122307013 [Carya illinoinensis]|uniref:GRF-type domain-containing protein n=1 Tax=Carya illinoinensis TaxID=32201 RepID=A0A922JS59_CARIL|nr:uncharacterized protein LOC122307013 [Carya illinoinensis]KAG6718538.1 hypothetical protein I3842_04G155500 [Carya illinoinensis]